MWKYIKDTNNEYMINENGEIKSLKSNSILKPYITKKGYKAIDLSVNGIKKKCLVHRLVAQEYVENKNNDPIVLHLDNDKLNINYKNLKWGTYSENNSQAIKDGINKLSKPDNRVWYDLYNPETNECKHFYGLKALIDEIGFGNDSSIRNYISRDSFINNGKYYGWKIRRSKIEKALRFRRNYRECIPPAIYFLK